MPDLTANPNFGFDQFGPPLGEPNALQNAPHAPVYGVPYGYLTPDVTVTPEPNLNTPDFDNPFNNPPDAPIAQVSPQSMEGRAEQQNQQNLGIPAAPPQNVTSLANVPSTNLSAIAMHGALLGTLAQQAVTQDAIANLAQNMTTPLGPPVGYVQAFETPMTMAEALAATTQAMNPTMSDAPSNAEGAPSAPGTVGIGSDAAASAAAAAAAGVSADGGDDGGTSSGGIGSEGGGGGAGGQGGGPGGSPGSGGVSGPGMGGIGSEGGGGGDAGEGGEGGE
jgi:hypothetical protein